MKNIAVWLMLGSLVVAVILFAIIGSFSVDKQENLPIKKVVTEKAKTAEENGETALEEGAGVKSAPEEKAKTEEEPVTEERPETAKISGTEWLHQFGSKGEDYPAGVAVDVSGNVYVVGYTYSSLPFTCPDSTYRHTHFLYAVISHQL